MITLFIISVVENPQQKRELLLPLYSVSPEVLMFTKDRRILLKEEIEINFKNTSDKG